MDFGLFYCLIMYMRYVKQLGGRFCKFLQGQKRLCVGKHSGGAGENILWADETEEEALAEMERQEKFENKRQKDVLRFWLCIASAVCLIQGLIIFFIL